jgi:hypothetical protein
MQLPKNKLVWEYSCARIHYCEDILVREYTCDSRKLYENANVWVCVWMSLAIFGLSNVWWDKTYHQSNVFIITLLHIVPEPVKCSNAKRC